LNIAPFVPEHILLSPRDNNTSLLQRLEDEEIENFFLDLRNLRRDYGKIIEEERMNIIIQNGKQAGQTVFHVHAHLIPYSHFQRKMSDPTKVNEKRKLKTLEELAKETLQLRQKFEELFLERNQDNSKI
jgi:diadenosine tetraphosphate (Ap4A) HIT family hydrolase